MTKVTRHPTSRGLTAVETLGAEETTRPSSGLDKARILLAVSKTGNRDRLKEHLAGHYKIIEPGLQVDDSLEYDLAIVDSSSYMRWRTTIIDNKFRNEPSFLPTILILSRAELKQRTSIYWDLVDEFIITPIDRLEFSERVAMLLRARHLALTQQAQLAYLATHDRVTGLPNKQRFQERLSEVILDATVLNQQVQIVVLRLSVVRIMSSLGHRGLDKAAVICSGRISSLLGPDHFLARLTTDIWGLILPPGQPMSALFRLCQALKAITNSPLSIDDEGIHITLNLGVGLYPDDASDAINTLDCAINAIQDVKDAEPHFYSQSVQHQALRYIRTETRLRQAILAEQFEVHYQPQINLNDKSVSGCEALIRWRLPNGRLAPPADFLSVAETTGLIVQLDRWVLKEACAAMSRWKMRGSEYITNVAVNITAEDLEQPDFVDYVKEQISYFKLSPEALKLELTESTLFESSESNLKKLNHLREYGIDIALDDFGTGYSCLSYLHTLPINVLKIDQSFVKNILEVESNAAITKTIVWLAKNFRLRTIAEGVETLEQAKYLDSLNVDIAQGYFYGRPMPEQRLLDWLREWSITGF